LTAPQGGLSSISKYIIGKTNGDTIRGDVSGDLKGWGRMLSWPLQVAIAEDLRITFSGWL
jgi:hypothetical protein